MIEAYIPDLASQIHRLSEYDETPNKYAVLDFIEFVYENLSDYDEYEPHSFMRHHHLSFPQTKELKEKFRGEINRLFERNGIVFYLDVDGFVKRHLPLELDSLINSLYICTSDVRLNEMISSAIDGIKNPNESDRIYALEKLWDAFERMKTYYSEKKKQSTEQLIAHVSAETDKFDELLDEEFRKLTDIGNKYQIRHFEQDKIQIKSLKHIDYLFYRMIALINMCIKSINIF